MMDAHRVVGSNGSIQERPFGLAAVLFHQFLEALFPLPEAEYLLF
jgi:hypothetical protein